MTALYFLTSPSPRTKTSSSSQNSGSVVISLGQTPRILGLGVTMNYTGSDEFAGYRSVKTVERATASPTLALFSMWTYTFSAVGTYHTDDALNLIPTSEATVVVT